MTTQEIITSHLPAIQKSVKTAFTVIRADGRILHATESCGPLLGHDARSLEGRQWHTALQVQGQNHEHILRLLLQDVLNHSSPIGTLDFPIDIVRAPQPLQISLNPWKLHSGEPIAIIGLNTYPQTNQSLSHIQKLAHQALEETKDLILIGEYASPNSKDPIILYANRACRTMLGYEPEEIVGTSPHDSFLGPEVDPEILKQICERISQGETVNEQLQYRRRNGNTFWVQATFRAIFNRSGEKTNWLAIQRDISIRKRAQSEAEAEKERLAVTLKSIAEAVVATNAKGIVTLFNEAAETLLSLKQKDALGRPAEQLFQFKNTPDKHPIQNPLARAISTKLNIIVDQHVTLITQNGKERITNYSASPVIDPSGEVLGGVLVLRDVTQSVTLSRELQKIDRIESLSQLAAGMAHDYRNLLTLLLGNLSFAKHKTENQPEISEILNSIEMGLTHAEGLTQRLESLAVGEDIQLKTLDIADFARRIAAFALRGSNIQLTLKTQQRAWHAKADEALMSQVLNNLIINAKHAMPQGGELHIEISNLHENNTIPLPLNPGKYLKLSLRDTGTGIAREHLDRIFDPYFTTKENGTGLGLASSYNIIRSHGGHIAVHSELGHGTTFDIYLQAEEPPQAQQEDQTPHQHLEQPQEHPPTQQTTHTPANNNHHTHPEKLGQSILVVDDEAMVRTIVSDMLTFLGCQVTTAEEGGQACRIYQQALEAGHPYDAVLLDLSIPGGMGARETIQPLLAIDAQAKAILSTGHHFDALSQNWQKHGFTGCIPKPYKLEDLKNILLQQQQQK